VLSFNDVIHLPLAAYERLMAKIPGVSATQNGFRNYPSIPCDTDTILNFAVGGRMVAVHPSDWIMPVNVPYSPMPWCTHLLRPSADYVKCVPGCTR
jgi:hypothetical protein